MAVVRTTILLSTALWGAVEALRLLRPTLGEPLRGLWTAAVVLAVAHAAMAFHVVYDWSHDTAIAATARQTAQHTGLTWGGGLYVNYLFLTLWAADALWWWRAPVSYLSRDPRLERARLALFTFMFVNGAIVFATGIARAVGVIAVGSVCAAWMIGDRRSVRHA